MPSDPPVLHGDLQGLYDLIDERGEEIDRLKRTHAMEVGGLREQLRAIQAPATTRLKAAYTERDPLWPSNTFQADVAYVNAYDRVREAINRGHVLLANDVADVLNELAHREGRLRRWEHEEIARLHGDVVRLSGARFEAEERADVAARERDVALDRLAAAIARRTGFARVLDDDDD